jgi:hypothetical protein
MMDVAVSNRLLDRRIVERSARRTSRTVWYSASASKNSPVESTADQLELQLVRGLLARALPPAEAEPGRIAHKL